MQHKNVRPILEKPCPKCGYITPKKTNEDIINESIEIAKAAVNRPIEVTQRMDGIIEIMIDTIELPQFHVALTEKDAERLREKIAKILDSF
jgi:hypothetical protein